MSTDSPTDSAQDTASDRRALLVSGGVMALVTGLGVGMYFTERRDQAKMDAITDSAHDVWGMQWDTPDGKSIALSTFRGRPLLLNFWASWCPPCVEELPLINAFFRQQRANGWQVLGLAADRLAPVQEFLRQMPLDFPVALAGVAGLTLSKALGNLAGGLPFTVIFNTDGAIASRKIGKVQPADLAEWAQLK